MRRFVRAGLCCAYLLAEGGLRYSNNDNEAGFETGRVIEKSGLYSPLSCNRLA